MSTTNQVHKITLSVGDKEIHLETGKIARQANGSIMARCGDTLVFTAATAASKADPTVDFMPLRVDYQEKFSSAGKTVSGFIKREGRPTEKETLTSRLIDRPIRPMFENGYNCEVQILSYVFSYDSSNAPDILAIIGASAALVLSDIPFIKPIGAVRVGLVNGKFVINPTVEELKSSKLDLVLAGTEDGVLMIEGECAFLTEEEVLEAIALGHEEIKKIARALENWRQKIGREKDRSQIRPLSEELLKEVDQIASPLLTNALKITKKNERENALNEVKNTVKEAFFGEGKESAYTETEVGIALKQIQAKYMRRMILDEKVRCDGRSLTDIRPITIEQSLLPRTHGSSLFTRGETQTIAVCTLGGESMAQRFETLDEDSAHRFYLQYYFPPFSVGEVGRVGSPGRREVGHGKLAERALREILPPKESFPYIIRVESNITESNGSSSMATVCGGCLALMDAGVPIKRPVSGIAMGLILEGREVAILSDILGVEDALGDMDFKVAGDENGITAFQMDIKIEGITIEIMKQALQQAKEGRIHILKKMIEVCPTPKANLSNFAPRIETMQIKPSKIGALIGPGGKQIRSIVETTGVQIDVDDNGLVSIASPNFESIEKAKNIIFSIVAEAEVGKIYSGKVTSVVPFGVFVEILPGKEGLCHISEYDVSRIQNLADFVKVGDEISVKLLEINDRGQLKLSRKATLVK